MNISQNNYIILCALPVTQQIIGSLTALNALSLLANNFFKMATVGQMAFNSKCDQKIDDWNVSKKPLEISKQESEDIERLATSASQQRTLLGKPDWMIKQETIVILTNEKLKTIKDFNQNIQNKMDSLTASKINLKKHVHSLGIAIITMIPVVGTLYHGVPPVYRYFRPATV